MKKVIAVMLIVTLIFTGGICVLFIYRQQNPDTVSVDAISAQQAGRYDAIHINPDGKLNINTATAEELSLLSGICDVLAQRIVQYRQNNGPYKAVEELLNVSGIGETKLANIINYIYAE